MSYVKIFESTLEKLTDEEKDNLQMSLGSYHAEGYNKGYDDGLEYGYDFGRDEGMTAGYENGYDEGFVDGESRADFE